MRRLKQGFTLMELLIVIAIIVVLTAVIVPAVSGYTARAKETVCLANRRALYSLVMTSVLSGDYSTGSGAFDAIYDPEKHTCPLGGEFSWVDEGDGGKIVCNHGGDDAGDGQDEETPQHTPAVPDDMIKLWDSGGTLYTLSQTAGVKEKIANNEMLAAGTVFRDESGACAVISWTWALGSDAKNMTVDELTAKYPAAVARLDGRTVVTQGELDANPTRLAGTICIYNGKYYYSRSASNQWNMPPGGVWIELL